MQTFAAWRPHAESSSDSTTEKLLGKEERELLVTSSKPAPREYSGYGTEKEVLYQGVDKRSLMNTGPEGLSSAEAAYRLERFGRNELAEKVDSKWVKLAKEFTRPMALMVWSAAFIELLEALIVAPHYWADVAILLVLQLVNCLLGWSEELKAGNAVAALKEQLKPEATVLRDGVYTKIDGRLLVPGDLVLLGSGASIPADCLLCKGKPIQVDQASLTGESLPVSLYPGDTAKMGSTCVRGESDAMVAATGTETFLGKTAALLNTVVEQGNFEKLLLTITYLLTGVGLFLVTITFIFLLARGAALMDALAFAVVLLVASIPIAMRVVCTTTMALGCRKLAEEKAIVTRLSAVEDIAGMNILCSDKTGTLTLNKMQLQDDLPIFCEGVTRHDVLVAAALATKWKEPPKDAVDTLVLNAIDLTPLDLYEQLEHKPFDPVTKHTESTLRRRDGTVFKVAKGAPHVLLEKAYNCAEIRHEVEATINDLAKRGVRCLAVACNNGEGGVWVFMGVMTFLDPPRPDSASTIAKAAELGVQVKMITGDHGVIAVEMCRTLGLGANVLGPKNLPVHNPAEEVSIHLGRDYGAFIEGADGFSQVFPEHKYLIVEALRQRGHVVGMTGDGVNDAPALKRADVGLAVQGSTDAARAASDVVLTASGLSTIIQAIFVSRQIFQRMKNYIIYRIACTTQLLGFFFLSCLIFRPKHFQDEADDSDDWPDFFQIPVMGIVVITILNDGTIISIAYDTVMASKSPEKWNLPILMAVSLNIGLVAMISSLWLLYMGLNSHAESSIMDSVGVGSLSYEEIQCLLFLKLSVASFVALVSSTLLAAYWPFDGMVGIDAKVVTYCWIYCIIFFIIQEVFKVGQYNLMRKYGYFTESGSMSEKDLSFGKKKSSTPTLEKLSSSVSRTLERMSSTVSTNTTMSKVEEYELFE
eukprot:gene12536-14816_t